MRTIWLVICVLLLSNCDDEGKTEVEYKVTCSGECDITYKMTGDTFTEYGKSGSWGITYKDESNSRVYLSAIKNTLLGSVSITIYLGGKKYKSASTSVEGDRITIEGTIP